MKQFTKFRQFADKAFVRPERTEVLSEDLQDAEKRIEFIKQTCEVTGKKIGACLQGQLKEGTPIEKRIKKVPEFVLGSSMLEFGGKLGHESILGEVLEETGKIEMKLGHETVAYEVKVDSVLTSLQNVIENELPGIYKLKRSLGKLTENMDSARAKLVQASRHSGSASAIGGKIDTAKDELEECQQKVEQCRDNLASEMYQLIAKESDIAQNIVQFLKYQQEYHLSISNILRELLPEVDTLLASSHNKPVYGTDLLEHLNGTGRTIAYPLELCVCGLLETALKEEGLFRIAGSSSKVKKLKSAFNAGLVDLKGLLAEFCDPHVIATALKGFFRELPQPLLTLELYNDWIDAIRLPETPDKLPTLKKVVQKLPGGNYDNLKYFIKFLKLLTDHQDSNKMSSANIAIVIGPNLLWSPSVGDGDGRVGGGDHMNMAMTHWFSSIVDQLVSNSDYFFPGDINFYVTCEKPTEQELLATASRKGSSAGILNGSILEDFSSSDDGHLVNMKRTQSNSSLDEQNSPPQPNGSPKPVIRRNKGKPAPLPPSAGHTKSTGHTGTAQDAPKTPSSIDRSNHSTTEPTKGVSLSRVESTKREGVWIPPSPSQTYNRKSVFLHGPGGGNLSVSASNKPSLGPPPKPPQPNLSKVISPEEPSAPTPFSGTNVPSALRPKSSFRSPSKFLNETKVPTNTNPPEGSGSGLQYSSSLPRHFQTENSYKSKIGQSPSRPQSIFSANPDSHPPIETIPKLTTFSQPTAVAKTENQPLTQSAKEMSPVKDMPAPSNPDIKPTPIGFENIEQEVRTCDHPRPVPAPRSSLNQQHPHNSETDDSSTHRGERPIVKAKPRDLTGKRSQTNIESPSTVADVQVKTHSRNSSTDSDVPISINNNKSDSNNGSGSGSSSQLQSRTNSRNDSSVTDLDKKYSIPRPHRLSVGSEDECEGVGAETGPTKTKGPSRPPRPQPPPPPPGTKGKAGTPGESTDL